MASIIELPQLTVRRGGPEDVVAATQLVYRVWHDTYDPHLPSPMCAMKSEGSFRAHIAKRIRKAWLAFYGDELVGTQLTDGDRELIILAAAWLGEARLIDNIQVTLD